MLLHHCRCFQEHVRMLLYSVRALCKAPGGVGSIWKYLEALTRATGVSGRFAYSFQTELHFADMRRRMLRVVRQEVVKRREEMMEREYARRLRTEIGRGSRIGNLLLKKLQGKKARRAVERILGAREMRQ
jgi:hypothetical protein